MNRDATLLTQNEHKLSGDSIFNELRQCAARPGDTKGLFT